MLSGNSRPHRLYLSINKLSNCRMDYPEEEDEADTFCPEPAEVLASLATEAVALIEDGNSMETVIYSALESAFNFGCKIAGEAQDLPEVPE